MFFGDPGISVARAKRMVGHTTGEGAEGGRGGGGRSEIFYEETRLVVKELVWYIPHMVLCTLRLWIPVRGP